MKATVRVPIVELVLCSVLLVASLLLNAVACTRLQQFHKANANLVRDIEFLQEKNELWLELIYARDARKTEQVLLWIGVECGVRPWFQ